MAISLISYSPQAVSFSFYAALSFHVARVTITIAIQAGLERSRVVALIGPRQCGKTTLASEFVPVDSLNYLDLEDPTSLMRLEEPMTALRDLSGIVVIDEIQRKPELFPILRVLSDRNPLPAKFLILGSASPDLIRNSSESLAGRIETIAIGGFSLAELEPVFKRHTGYVEGFPFHTWLNLISTV
jgi:uncharacterized protein